jgi:hypothetical protein
MSILIRRRLLGDDPMVGVVPPLAPPVPPAPPSQDQLFLAETFLLSEPPNYSGIDVAPSPDQLSLAIDFGAPVAP